MELPGITDLHADRNVQYQGTLAFIGWDFTGGTARTQVRLTPDATGAPLITMPNTASPTAEGTRIAYAGTDTVANHIAAGRLDPSEVPPDYADTDMMVLSLLTLLALKATMALASVPGEAGDTVELAYDTLITPAGGVEDKYVMGKFVVRGTVTQ